MKRLFPAALIVIALLPGCGKSSTKPDVRSQDTPRDVIKSLAACYRDHDIAGYTQLLADDFQFYLEPGRREELRLSPYWLREEDATATGHLFNLDGLTKVTIDLLPGQEIPVNEVGKENWIAIAATAYLDVEQTFEGEPEPWIYRVRGDQQLFSFRRGKSVDDTDPESANLYYLVEWRDFGAQYAPSPTPIEGLSWTTLKTLDY